MVVSTEWIVEEKMWEIEKVGDKTNLGVLKVSTLCRVDKAVW